MANQMTITHQLGGGIEPGLLVYRPNVRRQHGHGLGAFFGRLASRLIPLAKEYLLPHAKNAVKNVAADVLGGRLNTREDLKEALKSNAFGVLKGVGTQVLLNQSGGGLARGRKRKRAASKKSTKKTVKRRKVTKSYRKRAPKRKHKKLNRKTKTLRKSDFVTLFDD